MQLISSRLSSTAATEVSDNTMELTYIGIAPAWQGKGLGKKLIKDFIDLSRSKGYDRVVLSVEEENHTAIALYEKFNFRIVKSFSEGRYRRHRMELII
jgi:peptidyl-dipeptidase Dcp